MATIRLPADFKDFLRLLTSSGVEYLLIGGYAVSYFMEPGNVVRMGMPPVSLEVLTSISGVEFGVL